MEKKLNMMYVLLVSLLLMFGSSAYAGCLASITASTPTADFVDHGNGTVTHTKTGLMWKQCSEGLSGASCAAGAATLYTWQGAFQAAGALNAAGGFTGFTDWRVPNQKELNSIVERQCITPAVNITIFPATLSAVYWSASPYAYLAASAWNIGFSLGDVNVNGKTVKSYVRLVRGGQ